VRVPTQAEIIERCAQFQPREALAPGKLLCCREFVMALMRVGCRVSSYAHDFRIVREVTGSSGDLE